VAAVRRKKQGGEEREKKTEEKEGKNKADGMAETVVRDG
jgi:hypothetical protein